MLHIIQKHRNYAEVQYFGKPLVSYSFQFQNITLQLSVSGPCDCYITIFLVNK